MNQGRPFGFDELINLNGTGVIADPNNNNIVVALFQNNNATTTDSYIWVVNKDLSTSALSTKLILEGAYQNASISPRVDTYTSPNNSFVTINRTYNHVVDRTTITIPELGPGEGVMLKVIKSNPTLLRCGADNENLISYNGK
ncbi:hypothetical protein [Chryseobacterium tongliaoense]|uniref:hypothetical protein n=1 Tax=Chryseobacterium tongliaoense TaxID=3240933 RepID=UPI003511C2FF